MRDDQIRDILDALIRVKDRQVRRDIDAATCGTKHDWAEARKADEALEDARDAAVAALLDLAGSAPGPRRNG